tara:strand:- start:1341 stop:3608 length:2268 start_codon:yes stop_codon:yes gene_type:complete
MNVELPNGKVITDVPEGTSKEEVMKAAIAGGYATEEDFKQPKSTETPTNEEASLFKRLFGDVGSDMDKIAAYKDDSSFERMQAWMRSQEKGFTKGIVDPVVGAAELAARAVGQSEAADAIVKPYNKYMEDAGMGGQLIGAVSNPINRLFMPAAGASKLKAVLGGAKAGFTQGSLAPTSGGEDFASDKMFNAGLGAVLGGGIPLAGLLGSKLASFVGDVNISTSARTAAIRDHLESLLGPERDRAVAAIRQVGEYVSGSKPTVGAALNDAPSAAGLVAVEQDLAKNAGLGFQVRTADNSAARQAALRNNIEAPGGQTAEAAEAARTAITTDLRNDALEQANIAGPQLNKLDKEISDRFDDVASAEQTRGSADLVARNQAKLAASVPELERITGVKWFQTAEGLAEQAKQSSAAYTNVAAQSRAQGKFKMMQRDSLSKEGFYPLKTDTILNNIDSLMRKPVNKVNSLMTSGLNTIKKKIAMATDENGLVDSQALYAIRKEMGADLQNTYNKANAPINSALLSAQERKLQLFIDDAINEASGGTIWSKYLKSFSEYSGIIERRKVGKALADRLGGTLGEENAVAFAKAVINSKSVVAEALGKPTGKRLVNIVTDKEMAIIKNVEADLLREAKSRKLGASVTSKGIEETPTEAPMLLDAKVTITKSVLNYIRMGKKSEMDALVADLLLNPSKFADFIEGVGQFTKSAEKSQGVITGMMKTMSGSAREAFTAFVTPDVANKLIVGGGGAIGAVAANIARE